MKKVDYTYLIGLLEEERERVEERIRWDGSPVHREERDYIVKLQSTLIAERMLLDK